MLCVCVCPVLLQGRRSGPEATAASLAAARCTHSAPGPLSALSQAQPRPCGPETTGMLWGQAAIWKDLQGRGRWAVGSWTETFPGWGLTCAPLCAAGSPGASCDSRGLGSDWHSPSSTCSVCHLLTGTCAQHTCLVHTAPRAPGRTLQSPVHAHVCVPVGRGLPVCSAHREGRGAPPGCKGRVARARPSVRTSSPASASDLVTHLLPPAVSSSCPPDSRPGLGPCLPALQLLWLHRPGPEPR